MGLDWAAATHDVCVQAAGPARRECVVLAHRPAAIDAWGCTLRTRCNGQPVAVCLARKKGPLVSALRHYDVLVLVPVHPLPLATYREAFPPSRAKDDPTEAALQVESRLTHRHKRTPRTPQSPPMRALAQRVEPRRRLVGDTVRRTHRLTRARNNSFPHVLPWFDEQDPAIFCDVLNRWPPLHAAQRARRSTLEGCFRAPHGRSADRIAPRLQASKSAIALPTEAGLLTPQALLVPALVAPLRGTLQASADCDTAIAQRAPWPPDCPLFDALPGAGAVVAPRLLVAFGAHRERDTAAEDRQKYAGSAPVTERSGKQAWVHWRCQCPKFLRPTVVAWAAESIRHACWARVYSQQQRDTGKAHQAAVRARAFQWRRMLFRCGQERPPSNESVSLKARNRRGASLIHTLAKEA